jgi:hypothetical protein
MMRRWSGVFAGAFGSVVVARGDRWTFVSSRRNTIDASGSSMTTPT